MASKAKATIAIQKEILEVVDQESQRRHETRSSVIEEAIRYWNQRKLEQLLARGYQEMAEEDRKTAKRGLQLFKEIVR